MKRLFYLLVLISMLSSSIFAANGDINTTYGTSGFTNNVANTTYGVGDIITQSDDKIVIVRESVNGSTREVQLLRYDDTGTLDNSFGTGGATDYYTVGGGSDSTVPTKLDIDSSGNLYVAGYYTGGFLVKYTSAGIIDSSFGTDGNLSFSGKTTTFLQTNSNDFIIPMYDATGIKLYKYDNSGVVVAGFGSSGESSYFGSANDEVFAIFEDTSGNIFTFAYEVDAGTIIRMYKHSASGIQDTSFGSSGIVSFDLGFNPYGGFIQGRSAFDGVHFYISAWENGGNNDSAVLKVDSSGNLDSSFASDGKLEFSNEKVSAVYVKDLGTIITVGQSNGKANVQKRLADGSLDTSFATDGNLSITTNMTEAQGAAFLSNGDIVVAGSSSGQIYTTRVENGNYLSITVTINNLNLNEYNITNVQYVGVDGNSENLSIPYDFTDGANTLTAPIFSSDASFSIYIDTNNSSIGSSWWYNFNDGKFYVDNNGSSDFKNTISAINNTFTIDAVSTNWENRTPKIDFITYSIAEENSLFILNLSQYVYDPDGDTLTYSLSGTDASVFLIDETGDLNSTTLFDYESPSDFNSDNVYDLVLSVSDGNNSISESITITVTNVDEDGDGDADGDGVSDGIDKFPNDVAASIDNDSDGYPDSWNNGYSQNDSTTGLLIDFYPYDSSFYASCGVDNRYDVCLVSDYGVKLEYISEYDDVSEVVDMNFSFPFFDQNYTSITISSNGYIKPGNNYYANEYWHEWNWNVDGDTSPIIAPFWTDLYPEVGGNIYYAFSGSEPNRTLTISYIIINHYDQEGSFNTFYVDIHENGDILYRYGTLEYVEDSTGYNNAGLVGLYDGHGGVYSLGEGGDFDEGDLDNYTISMMYNNGEYLMNVLNVPDSSTCSLMNGVYDSTNLYCNIEKRKSIIQVAIDFTPSPSSYVSGYVTLIDANRTSGSKVNNSFYINSDTTLDLPITTSMEYVYIKYFVNSSEYIQEGYYSTGGTVFSLSDATPVALTSTNTIATILVNQGHVVSGIVGSGVSSYNLNVVPIRVDGKDELISSFAYVNSFDGNYSLHLSSGIYKFMYVAYENSEMYDERAISNNLVEIAYYNSSGSVSSFKEAESVSINADTTIDIPTLSNGYRTLSFDSGWNLLSMPSRGVYTGHYLRALFSTSSGVSHLVKYNPFIGWNYFWIDESSSVPNYSKFSELSSTEGFWLKSSYAGNVNIPLSGDESLYGDEMHSSLTTGWNLIGFPIDKTISSIASNVESTGKIVKEVWVFRSGVWYVHFPYSSEFFSTLDSSDTVSASEGIWLNLE